MTENKAKPRIRAGNATYETLREMAIEYRFRPGEKINEVDLAEKLGVSRTPVREALNRLVSEELIQFRRNYGFYCRTLELKSVLELSEARRDIELATLPRIPERAPIGSLEDLAAQSRQIVASIGSLPACDLARGNEAFHVRLVEIGGNEAITQIVRNLAARLRFVDKILIETAPERARSFQIQSEIADALCAGDVDVARRALQQLLDPPPDELERALSTGLGRLYLNGIHMDTSFSSN